jgi:cytochrome c1
MHEKLTFPLNLWLLTAAIVSLTFAAFFATNALREQRTKIEVAKAMTGGDPSLAPALFHRFGCSGCHTIAGIPGANGQTGAPLIDFAERKYIAGVLENNSDNLVQWIMSPRKFNPQTAMPDPGLTQAEAKDLAAFLYSH